MQQSQFIVTKKVTSYFLK